MQRPLVGVTRHNLVRELLAGVTLLAIAIPLNIGYAQIAGLPATAGLYALVVPTIVYVLVLADDDRPTASLLDAAQPGTVTAPGIGVVRMAAPLFFANADAFATAVRSAVDAPGPGVVRHLVIDMEAVTDADVTAAESFESLMDSMRSRDVRVSFSRLRASAEDRLKRLDILRDQSVFETNRAAIEELSERAPSERGTRDE